ncbi:MAG: V-type ATP synthase subunit I [Bacillota bacterium]
MAVASMHRFALYGLRQDLPRFLSVLQETAAVEIEPPEEMEEETLPWAGPAVEALERELGELERAVAFFERFAPRRPNLIEQFAGVKTVLAEEEFLSYARDEVALQKALSRIKEVEAEYARLGAELHERQGILAQLRPWRGLGLTRAELEGTRHVAVVLGLLPPKAVEGLKAALCAEPRAVLRVVSADEREARLILFWPREADPAAFLGDLPLVQVSLPAFAGRLEEAIADEEAACARLEEALASLAAEAGRLAAERPRIEARLDYLRSELAKFKAAEKLLAGQRSFGLAGWVPERRVEKVRRALAATGAPHVFTTRPPLPGEEPPVALENPPAIAPFEALVQGFSYPRYEEIDPTPVTAPFFFLFFGFCLSDAGYGLVLILFCLGLLKWLKMTPVGKKLARLFIYGGVGAIIMGFLTGGFFGDLLGIRGVIDPIGNALVLLGIALALGLVQLFLGTILSALPNLRAGRWRDVLFDQGVWLCFLVAVMLLLGKGSLGLARYGRAINYFALASALGLVYGATRDKRGLVAKLLAVPSGLFRIYNSIGFFSDVLSYSRLMALGLSGGVMAMIINLFARMAAGGGPVGIALGILIGVFGHALNVALSILGAYVHSSRLQFLEFYGKFFEGGGRPFRPLRPEHKYTLVVKEKEA